MHNQQTEITIIIEMPGIRFGFMSLQRDTHTFCINIANVDDMTIGCLGNVLADVPCVFPLKILFLLNSTDDNMIVDKASDGLPWIHNITVNHFEMILISSVSFSFPSSHFCFLSLSIFDGGRLNGRPSDFHFVDISVAFRTRTNKKKCFMLI